MKIELIYIIIMGLTISFIVFILQLFKIYNVICFVVGFYTYKLLKIERKIIDDKTKKVE